MYAHNKSFIHFSIKTEFWLLNTAKCYPLCMQSKACLINYKISDHNIPTGLSSQLKITLFWLSHHYWLTLDISHLSQTHTILCSYLFPHLNLLPVLSMLDWSLPLQVWHEGLWFDLVGTGQAMDKVEYWIPQMHLQMLFFWNSPALDE